MKRPWSPVLAVLAIHALAFASEGPVEHAGPDLSIDEAPLWNPAPIPWGLPLRQGPIDVLFIVPRAGLRDVVELARRIDLRPETIALDTAPDGPALERLSRRLEAGPSLVVLANLDAAALTGDLIGLVLEAARNGAGLFLIPFGRPLPAPLVAYRDSLRPLPDTGAIIQGLGPHAFPGSSGPHEFVRLYEGEAARFAQFDHAAAPPRTHAFIPEPTDIPSASTALLENHWSLVAKALRWAAGREPEVRIAAVEDAGPQGPDADEIPPELPWQFVQRMRDAVIHTPLHPYVLRFDKPTGRALRVQVRIRYPHRPVQRALSPERPIPKGSDSTVVQIPLGLGDSFLDFCIEDKKGVVDWYTQAVHTEGWPEVSDFQCAKSIVKPNDSLRVSLQVRPHFHTPRTSTVYFRATDALGRVVAEEYADVPAQGGHISATLDFVDLIARSLKVEAFAVDATHRPLGPWDMEHAAYRFEHVLVEVPHDLPFSFVAQGDASLEHNARGFNRVLADMGVDTIHTSPGHVAGLAPVLDNLHTLSNLVDPIPQDVEKTRHTLPYTSEEKGALGDRVIALWPHTSSLYSLGQDMAPPPDGGEPPCTCPDCTRSFRAFLRNAYPDLATLNFAWGPAFPIPSWDSLVYPERPRENALLSFVPSLDRRRYLDHLFNSRLATGRSVVRDLDRRARAGFSATARSDHDWWTLASRLDLIGIPPAPLAVEKIRSYRQPRSFTGLRLNGGPEPTGPEQARWLPWYAALHGFTSVWLDNAYPTRPHAALKPGGGPMPWLLETAAAIGELKSGTAELLQRATRQHSGIALYGSHASLRLNPFVDRDSLRAEAGFVGLLEGLGYQFDFISQENAAQGGLDHYQVLILPSVTVLSDDEIGALLAFRAGGGALIADVLPGLYTEHNIQRLRPPLAEVFGARPSGPGASGSERIWPYVSTASPGAGLSALLGHFPPGAAPSETFRKILQTCLEQAGAVPAYAGLLTETPEFDGEIVEYRYADARILAFLRPPKADPAIRKLRLGLGGDAFPYDLRGSLSLKRGKKAVFPLGPGGAALIGFLPYEVSRLVLESPATVRAGRRLPVHVTVKTRGALPGDHLVHLSLAPRNGPSLRHYDKTIPCAGGQADTYFPLARNDVAGPYTITAHDLLSGATATADVILTGVHY